MQLADGAKRSRRKLVEDLGRDHSTATRMLERRERAGIVHRGHPHPSHGRVMLRA
ncbi:MAG TPA: hypothetical protein VKV27_06695 [Solirubrobacteraceae bacterium]|nr:hypothetical protein [Solirubrobacteraceae bacterium]